MKRTVLTPLYDKLLVKRLDTEDVEQVGSLYVPTDSPTRPHVGMVIAAGKGVPQPDGTLRPLTVKPFDKIMWEKYGGAEITMNKELYVILSEEEVLGVITEEKQ